MLEFSFDELKISIDGLYCGCFAGDAEIDDDGSVIAITLAGWNGYGRDAKAKTQRFLVPPRVRQSWPLSGAEKLIMAIAGQLEAQCAETIRECLSEYREACREREYDANEVV